MVFIEFSLRFGETIDLYDAAFRDSTLASNIELFHELLERWPCGRSRFLGTHRGIAECEGPSSTDTTSPEPRNTIL
jgi:hypothetical protein